MGNRSRTEADRTWSRAQHAAHSKNKLELRLLENSIGALNRNQYLAKIRYRQQILDIKESIWPLRASTGYAHSYLDGVERERADRRRRAHKERFVNIVRKVITMTKGEDGFEETDVASKTDNDCREIERDKLITSESEEAKREGLGGAGMPKPDIVVSLPEDASKENVTGQIRRERDSRTGHHPSDNQIREVLGFKRDRHPDGSAPDVDELAGGAPSLRGRYEVYGIDFSALSIAQNRANSSTAIIGRGPVSLPKCLEHQQCLADMGARSFTAALTPKATRKLGGGNNKNESTHRRNQWNRDSESGKRLSSGVSLSRYVRAVEAGLPAEHLTSGIRDIRIPVSRGQAKRERIRMMKEIRRPRTTSDLEKRRMELIQAKIDSFLCSLPVESVDR